MSPRLTSSQIERLGASLVASTRPDARDLAALHELLAEYNDTLNESVERVRNTLGVAPTARIKNTGTILEKLRRYGGSWLKSLHDLAGMRIVGDFDRAGQDALAAQLVDLFSSEERAPRIVDRRAEPVQGYRAVHVIVFPNRIPVEIQIRTRWQHEWAELFEKLADRLGRGIRYGEPPTRQLSSGVDGESVVRLAILFADAISGIEVWDATSNSPRMSEIRERLDELLPMLQSETDLRTLGPPEGTLCYMAHFLLVYDRDAGRLVSEQQFETSDDALRARFEAEANLGGRSEIEIVVLSAESPQDLVRTHGRYFLGLSELAARMA